MPADWAAQRVKNLDLGKAVINAILPKRNQTEITTLIEEFQYPKFGPGMMWEGCAEKVRPPGGRWRCGAADRHHGRGGRAPRSLTQGGRRTRSRRPTWSPPCPCANWSNHHRRPAGGVAAADDLHYRDYLTVALVVPEPRSFPDNWIYIHATDVEVGRIQNYGSWSPYLVKDGRTCLGLEYFVFEGDAMWNMPDDELIERAPRELVHSRPGRRGRRRARLRGARAEGVPVLRLRYKANVKTIRKWIEANAPNIHPVGRNGMHKYNNQDHSMYTAMLTVENIFGADHDVWAVNVEEEYHESGSTGRDAPALPRRAGATAGTLDTG